MKIKKLSELARELQVSASWINKVQRLTNNPFPIAKRRIKDCTFTQNDINILAKIKILRYLGLSYENIKKYLDNPTNCSRDNIEFLRNKRMKSLESFQLLLQTGM